MSYLSERVPKLCRECFAAIVNRHNGKRMQRESCALRDRNAADSGFDRFPEQRNRCWLSKIVHVIIGLLTLSEASAAFST